VSGWEQRARPMAKQIMYLSRWTRPGDVGSREVQDASFGAYTRVLTADLSGAFNRIVPFVSLPAIPAAQPAHETP
jgi:hypothetical protein